jgi:ABC-type siderophore export system fused ATPase/permease subunit
MEVLGRRVAGVLRSSRRRLVAIKKERKGVILIKSLGYLAYFSRALLVVTMVSYLNSGV